MMPGRTAKTGSGLGQEPRTFAVSLPNGRTITGPNEDSVRRVAHQLEEQLIRRTMWPGDNREQISTLARLFPSMRRWDGSMVPGTEPWDPLELVRWLNESGEPTSGSRHAALFLLSVWNPDDWQAAGLKVRRGSGRIGRFDFNDAWAAWDDAHRTAALAWLTNPFWP